MKITLLYGLGEVGKRTEALKIKKQFTPEETIYIDLKTDSIDLLRSALSTKSLFDTGQRLVVIENPPEKLDLGSSVPGDDQTNLVVIAGQLKPDAKLLQSVQELKGRVLVFEGEKETSAFPYLDCLIEGKKQAFGELEKLYEEYGGMYILTMIYYLLRRNILPLPASSFARNKIISQKKSFNGKDWEKLYELTLNTDLAIKTGAVTEHDGLVRLTQAFLDFPKHKGTH